MPYPSKPLAIDSQCFAVLGTAGMDRKRRRLETAELLRRLARTGGHSTVGLSEILAEVRRDPGAAQALRTPGTTRRDVGDAALAGFDVVKHVGAICLSLLLYFV